MKRFLASILTSVVKFLQRTIDWLTAKVKQDTPKIENGGTPVDVEVPVTEEPPIAADEEFEQLINEMTHPQDGARYVFWERKGQEDDALPKEYRLAKVEQVNDTHTCIWISRRRNGVSRRCVREFANPKDAMAYINNKDAALQKKEFTKLLDLCDSEL